MPVRRTPINIPEDIKEEYSNLNASYKKAEGKLNVLNIEREEILKKALSNIDDEILLLQTKLDKLKRAMEVLYPTDVKVYDKDASWKEKILWVLKNLDRVIPASAIIGKIKMNESNIPNDIAPIVRLTIRRMEAKGEIITIEDSNLNSKHYALPEWFDDVYNLKLKEAYYY